MADASMEHSEPGSGPTPILPGQTFPAGVPPYQTMISGGDVDPAITSGSRRQIYPEDFLQNPHRDPAMISAEPPEPGE